MTSFGVDFGTTNSLAAVVVGDRVVAFVDETDRPHPSVLWYRGTDVVVGREARKNMDLTDSGAPPGFVRSPKMALRRLGPLFVDGRPIEPTDAVAEVLKHLRKDAALAREDVRGQKLERAVMTIPVDFGGPERRALREAARKSAISVVQFVHEPVAALYAYIRSQSDMGQELAKLDGRSVLVFDWGGGTLDLTLCRIRGGTIVQVSNFGDNEVGGDRFDEKLRNLIRQKHATAHRIEDVSALEYPGMAAKLLHQCETVKISLSSGDNKDEAVFIRNYIKSDGPTQHLNCKVTRAELDKECAGIVNRGLARIDKLLERASLSKLDLELCLATGGMVNMPAIRDGLTERFPGRVPRLLNGDRIIAEGAAWIAHDGLRLTLSKPVEILTADTSGSGTYYPLVQAGVQLPVENETKNVANTRLFCTDPREGVAVIELAKPLKLDAVGPTEPRTPLCVASVEVDATAQPLMERIECHLQIDHDYVATVTLRSTALRDERKAEFHDLEFALALPQARASSNPSGSPTRGGSKLPIRSVSTRGGPKLPQRPVRSSNLIQRSNVGMHSEDLTTTDMWRTVPGDLVATWRPNHFDKRYGEATARQLDERDFYNPCGICGRLLSQARSDGPLSQCGRHCKFL